MRILVLAGDLDRPETAIFSGLAQRGAIIHVVGAISDEHSKRLVEMGATVSQFAFRNRFDISGMRLIRRLVRAEGIELVYALSNRALSAAVIGLTGIRVPIAAYRGTVGHISWFDPSSWFTYLNPKVRKIICVSRAVEEYLLGLGIDANRLTTVYKGHDPEWYQVAPASRASFGIPEDAFVVGCTAVMRAVKGIDDLMDAVELLLAEIPSLHLVLVGSVKDRDIEERLRAFREPERLHWTGYRPDATALASLYDVVVMASKNREGFPKSVIEAMAQGVPAVVTAVGGMPELVGNGVAGILAKPCDPESLAQAIREIYEDSERRAALGKAARERIASTFHVANTIERMHTEFSKLCESL